MKGCLRVTIDPVKQQLIEETEGGPHVLPLYSPEAFAVLSRYWLAVGWTQKYTYSFTWMGRPIIQLPEDVLRIQEVVHAVRPDVIVETGVAHGGSLVFYASLCKVLGQGRVIGVDIEIRAHNRNAIEAHPLAGYITLIEGHSTAVEVVDQVRARVRPGETVLVLLDSCHSRAHVLAELRAYGPLVSKGSYIVVADGIMAEIAGAPGTRAEWAWDNPRQAALEFAAEQPQFALHEPALPFNEGAITHRVTHWPSAFLRRVA
jgi:cephalosporin hydroxylase